MDVDSWRFKLLQFYGLRVRHPGHWRVHALLRDRLRPGIDADLPVSRNGHRWVLNPSDYVQSELFWLGERDRWDIYHLGRLLREGTVMFDVGANFGHYAITLADVLHRHCEVHAFEPFPPNFQRLRRNVALNALESVVTLHPFGLSDSAGTGHMTVRRDNSGSATLAAGGPAGSVPVDLTTLDDFCVRNQITQLDFIKLDVEGYEARVLDGGYATIRKFAPMILVELESPRLRRAGSSVDRVVGQLRDHGYELFTARRRKLLPLGDFQDAGGPVNAFCVKKGRAAELAERPRQLEL